MKEGAITVGEALTGDVETPLGAVEALTGAVEALAGLVDTLLIGLVEALAAISLLTSLSATHFILFLWHRVNSNAQSLFT